MGYGNFLLVILLLAYVPISQSQLPRKNNPLRILHQWVFANFDYNSTQDRLNAEQLGYLFPGNVAILDGDYFVGSNVNFLRETRSKIIIVRTPLRISEQCETLIRNIDGNVLIFSKHLDPKTHKMRIFVSTPQFLTGIPATFSEVRDQKREEPLMSPFPSWDAQNIAACSGPVSVYRVFIDRCGLLWVLDSGMVETFLVPRRVCNPKVLIYDLNDNDKLITRYDFPAGVIAANSILITLVTESYQKDCRDSIAYIADVQARGLIMFDWPKRTSWRVENSYFYPFPDHGTVRIKDTTFELMDGLFGLALSPATDRERKLYFHSAASVRESWVLTSVLKNSTIVSDVQTLRGEFHHSEDVREGQSTVEVMTDDGILIYPVLNKNALACWNSAQPLKMEFQHIILEDNDNLQFVTGMKLKNKTLLITTSKLQHYLLFQANGTDVKYRVMMIDNIDQLLDSSPCRKGQMVSTVQTPVTAGSTQRYFTTTYKPTTSHEIVNKFFPQKPTSNKVDDKQTINFVSHGHHDQPPYWHPGRDQGTLQKQPSHAQIPQKTSQGSSVYSSSSTFGESKYHATTKSSIQHWPQEPKSHKNPTSTESRDPINGKESAREEKSSSDSVEGESRNKPSVFQKPTLIRVSQKSPSYGHPQLNNF